MPVNELWEEARDILKDELSTASYTSFIEELLPVALNDRTIVLQAADDFMRKTLSERYLETVQDALKQVAGNRYFVRFITPAERSFYERPAEEECEGSLNPKYTFDNFIVGSSNKFPHAVAVSVSQSPGTKYNPFFIYGDVGLGKTHLMQAIGNEIKRNDPSAKVMYVTSEKFTNEMIQAIRSDRNEEFRQKYRNVDVLLIDDIQFIGDKEGTQEEFFHTFNALYDNHKQIVISSDKQPRDIPSLEERLSSRFGWGVIADIQRPNLETRVAILEYKAHNSGLSVDHDVLYFIAAHVDSNVRELEGSLTRVVAKSDLIGEPVTVQMAEETLKDMLPKKVVVDADYIRNITAKHYKILPADLVGKKRSNDIAFPRQVAMYLCRFVLDLSLEKIGSCFGGRDHTTVKYAVEKVQDKMQNDAKFKREIEDLLRKLSEG